MSYYCHNCQDAKQQSKIEHCADGLVCKDCRSDFLEELNEQHFPSLVFEQSSGSSSGRHLHRHHPYSYALLPGGAAPDGAEASASAAGSATASSPSGGGGEVFRLRLSRGGGGASGGATAGHGELDQLIQSLFQQVFGIVGDLDDYAMGVDSLDNVVTQLMNQLDGGGPPPATPDDLRRIQSVAVTEEQQADLLQCSVCFDEFLLGCYVDQLPCQHCFHHNCILPWLEKHGTCPVCRKSLSGEDTSTQTFVEQSAAATAAAAAAPVAGASARQSAAAHSSASSLTSRRSAAGQLPLRRNLRRRNPATSSSSTTTAAAAAAASVTSATASRSRDRSSGEGGSGASGTSSHTMDED